MASQDGLLKEEGALADKPVRLAPRIACAALTIVRAYLERGRRPLPHEDCAALVAPFGTQPNLVLHQLERAGVLVGDGARGTGRARIVNPDQAVEAKAGGRVVRFWPDPEQAAEAALSKFAPDATVEGPPQATSVPPSPAKRRQHVRMTAEDLEGYLRERHPSDEFTTMQIVREADLSTGLAYARFDELVMSGRLVRSGGTKGNRDEPARYRLVEPGSVTAEVVPDVPYDASQTVSAIKTRSELEAELAGLVARRDAIEASEQIRLEARRKIDEALARIERLEAELVAARRQLVDSKDVIERNPVPDERSLLELDRGIRETSVLIEQYDFITARLLRR